MLVIGDKDIEANTVSVRTRAGDDLGAISLLEFEGIIGDIVDNKKKILR